MLRYLSSMFSGDHSNFLTKSTQIIIKTLHKYITYMHTYSDMFILEHAHLLLYFHRYKSISMRGPFDGLSITLPPPFPPFIIIIKYGETLGFVGRAFKVFIMRR